MRSGRLMLLRVFFLCIIVFFANDNAPFPVDDCNAPIYDKVTYVIDNKAVLKVIPDYLKAEVNLKNLRKKNEDDLRTDWEKYQDDLREFESKKDDMSVNEIAKYRELLKVKQDRIQVRAEEMERTYEIESDKQLKPHIDRLNSTISDALKGRVNVIVVDKKFVSYYDKKLDITEFMKRKMKALSLNTIEKERKRKLR